MVFHLLSVPLRQKPLKMNDHDFRILRNPRFNFMRRVHLALVAMLLNFTAGKMVGDAVLHRLSVFRNCHRQRQLFICCVRLCFANWACSLVQQLDFEVFSDWAVVEIIDLNFRLKPAYY